MGANLRIIWDGLHHRLTATATSAAAGFELANLFDGSRHSYWRATSTAEQVITWDAGSGNTETVDTTVIARADLLVNANASVVTQWSADAATGWTNAYTPKAPIAFADLRRPAEQDACIEHDAALAKRGWRLRLYGVMSSAPQAALVWLGRRLEVERNPAYGSRYGGPARAHRGAGIELGPWAFLSEAGMDILLYALTQVSPSYPAEGLTETAAGAVYGGRPHFLYDPTGEALMSLSDAAPALVHVLLTSPDVEARIEFDRTWSLDPVRWRQVV